MCECGEQKITVCLDRGVAGIETERVQGVKSFNLTGCMLTDPNASGRRVGGVERYSEIIDQPRGKRFARCR